eukprot:3979-Hanusia_phi.AAC.4
MIFYHEPNLALQTEQKLVVDINKKLKGCDIVAPDTQCRCRDGPGPTHSEAPGCRAVPGP